MPAKPKRRLQAKTRRLLTQDWLWVRVAQIFVGLFFVAASYFKLTDSFFGARIVPISQDINYWLDSGFTLRGYREFLKFMLPYADFLASVVILCQCAVGVLLVYNKRLRWAAMILIFVQTNILLSTFNGFGFIVFSGVAIWLGVFYFFRESMTPRIWSLLTWALLLLGFKYQHQRYVVGDAWMSSFAPQYAHFQQDVMSIHPVLKQWLMNFWDGHAVLAPWLWASSWWIHTALLLLMLTRFRLYAGFGWLLIWVHRELVWTTGVTGEGTLYVLVLFTWVTFEEYMQQRYKPGWLLPSRQTWSGAWWRVRSWLGWGKKPSRR
ncbi:MAG TPA: DoxX family membrane protein [Candidatus Peribacteria bacterium]|nr:DoxX family membrane protein [Candidatus Peribacteria bacterium]